MERCGGGGGGVCSWSWFNPHKYTPFISDIWTFEVSVDLHFELGRPPLLGKRFRGELWGDLASERNQYGSILSFVHTEQDQGEILDWFLVNFWFVRWIFAFFYFSLGQMDSSTLFSPPVSKHRPVSMSAQSATGSTSPSHLPRRWKVFTQSSLMRLAVCLDSHRSVNRPL